MSLWRFMFRRLRTTHEGVCLRSATVSPISSSTSYFEGVIAHEAHLARHHLRAEEALGPSRGTALPGPGIRRPGRLVGLDSPAGLPLLAGLARLVVPGNG